MVTNEGLKLKQEALHTQPQVDSASPLAIALRIIRWTSCCRRMFKSMFYIKSKKGSSNQYENLEPAS